MKLIGIDCGIRKVDMAFFQDQEMTHASSLDVSERYSRPEQIAHLAHVAGQELNEFQPDYIYIEDNLVGNNIKYSIDLARVVGAITASIGRGDYTKIDYVNVSTWKKQVVGKGNASKAQVAKYLEETYPKYAALCDGSQDRIDATCVGLYGLRHVELSRALTSDSISWLGPDR